MNQLTSGIQYLLSLLSGSAGQNPLDMIYMKSMVLSAEYGYLSNPYYSFKLNYAFPYEGAIADARKQMLINLGEQSPTISSSFSFNGFEEYQGGQWVKSYYDERLPFEDEEDSFSQADQDETDIEKVNNSTKEETPSLNKVPNSSSSTGGSNTSSNQVNGTTGPEIIQVSQRQMVEITVEVSHRIVVRLRIMVQIQGEIAMKVIPQNLQVKRRSNQMYSQRRLQIKENRQDLKELKGC